MKIPKIIHQIWIGPNIKPDIWMDNITKFCEEYNYTYMLWNEDKIKELNLINNIYYDKEKTYNGKSDILRYEILYNYGGIYIDADCVILKYDKFNHLLEEFDNHEKKIAFGYEIDNKLITN
jgi:mannosyltransferase OCH1-like enzyme